MHVIEWMENGVCMVERIPRLANAIKLLKELESRNIKATHIFEE